MRYILLVLALFFSSVFTSPVQARSERDLDVWTEAIVRTMLDITKDHPEETPEERRVRLTPLAAVMAEEARGSQEISFILSQGWHESRFVKHVQLGECRKGTCDPDKKGQPRAHGPFQAWRVPDREPWQLLWEQARTEGTAAVRLQLEMQRAWECGGDLVRRFAAHGGGGCEATKDAKRRVKAERREAMRQRIERRLHTHLSRVRQEARTAAKSQEASEKASKQAEEEAKAAQARDAAEG